MRAAKSSCQLCDSIIGLQRHHIIPGDDETIITLCASCHARVHPEVPSALILDDKQPYWDNYSLAEIAAEIKTNTQNVKKIAGILGIPRGIALTEEQHNQFLSYYANEEEKATPKDFDLSDDDLDEPKVYCKRVLLAKDKHGEDCFKVWGKKGGNPILLKGKQ